MNRNLPLVTVVVVTVDHVDLLRNCLTALTRQDYGNLEILVVDNGSTEDVQGMVSREFPDIRIIRLEKNQGFAGGNNRAIEKARGQYVALINNDAVASGGWVSALVNAAEGNNRIGAVASLVLDGNKPGCLDSCGVEIALDGMSRQAMRGMSVPKDFPAQDILTPSGSACLLRIEALKEVGLFDERFFAYCEDTDLGLRMVRAGWKAVSAPEAQVTHYYSLTGGKYSLQKIYWVERNHVWVAVKNFPWFLLVLFPLMTGWRYLVHLYSLITGEGDSVEFISSNSIPAVARTLIRANGEALWKTPFFLNQRIRDPSPKRISSLEMGRILFHHRISFYELINGYQK